MYRIILPPLANPPKEDTDGSLSVTAYATTELDAKRIAYALKTFWKRDSRWSEVSTEEIRSDLYKQILEAIDADDLEKARDLNRELKMWG